MRPTCSICRYYCFDVFAHDDALAYDYSDSFCGLHGREHITDPNSNPPDLMHFPNEHYNCRCGFIPLHRDPVQLSLFDI